MKYTTHRWWTVSIQNLLFWWRHITALFSNTDKFPLTASAGKFQALSEWRWFDQSKVWSEVSLYAPTMQIMFQCGNSIRTAKWVSSLYFYDLFWRSVWWFAGFGSIGWCSAILLFVKYLQYALFFFTGNILLYFTVYRQTYSQFRNSLVQFKSI